MRILEKLLNDDFVLNSNKIKEDVMSRSPHLGEKIVFKSVLRKFEGKGDVNINLRIILKGILKN